MGFDITQFLESEKIKSDLICSICSDVLKAPVIIDGCEHVFCRECLEKWMDSNEICPLDRNSTPKGRIRSAPRIYCNLIDELLVHCQNASKGCEETSTFGRKEFHLKECLFEVCDDQIVAKQSDENSLLFQIEFYKKEAENYKKLFLEAKNELSFKIEKEDLNDEVLRSMLIVMVNMSKSINLEGMPFKLMQSGLIASVISLLGCKNTTIEYLAVGFLVNLGCHGNQFWGKNLPNFSLDKVFDVMIETISGWDINTKFVHSVSCIEPYLKLVQSSNEACQLYGVWTLANATLTKRKSN